MPWPVHSTRLCSVYGQQAATFTCPAGYRAVLKSVAAYNGGSTLQSLWVTLVGLDLYRFDIQALGTATVPNVMAVFYEGETLRLTSGGSAIAAQASGFLLVEPEGALRGPPEVVREPAAPPYV